MKLVININEKDFHRICQGYISYSDTLEGRALAAISEGTPSDKYTEQEPTFCSDISKVSKEELDRINANIKEQQERAYKCIKQSRQERIESLKKELNETKVAQK